MSPAEMLDVIDVALARARAKGRLRRRATVLELNVPRVLGVTGRHLRDDDDIPVYGYTVRDCRRIRAVIEHAAYADLAAIGAP